MPVDPSRVQSVFGAALEYDVEDRAAVLDRECSTDEELRRRVEALLDAHYRPDSFLDRPIVGPAHHSLDPPTSSEEVRWGGVGTDLAIGSIERSDPTVGHPLDADPDADGSLTGSANRVVPAISGYEILAELGRGGMGVVYKARQVRLDRPCALKMILGGAHARPEAAARFLAEARAIAHLQHPHIVQIYHIGESEGLLFFELEYVDGGSLDRTLDGTPWVARRAAGLVQRLAGAVDEAHRQGIVHRDLKPGNILLMADGTPKIADFGLAKSMGADSGLTATDLIMGSPSYMAPEQAAGRSKHLGPAADIYALGSTLYELLTGRPPFRGATILETLEQVKTLEPVSPSRLVPGLPRDIETIALKCLQKEPGKRYESADALAEDLRRFLGGEPIVARPVRAWERAWRWCRRHPALAALTVSVVLSTVLGLAGILWQWGEAVKARDLASKRAIAEAEARREEAKARLEVETTLVDMYATSGISAGDRGEPARAALWFSNAARRADADPARRQANEIRARSWSRLAPAPLHAIVTGGSWPGGFLFHPSGRYLITKEVVSDNDPMTKNSLWDMESERSIPLPGGHDTVTAAAWSPDGGVLAVGLTDGDVVISRFPEGDGTTRIPFPARIRRLTYSTDGHYLAIAGGKSVRVWDVRSRTFATPDLVHPSAVTTFAFHPGGQFLATGCRDGLGRLFAVPGDSVGPLWPPVPHVQTESRGPWAPVFCSPPMFVDGGRSLITYGGKEGLTWREVKTGAPIRSLKSPEVPEKITLAELSPDSRWLAVYSTQSVSVRLLETETGRPIGPPLAHENTVYCAAFSQDGRMLLTGSSDNTARAWAVPGGKPVGAPLDLHRTVYSVGFAPPGSSLVTQDGDLVRFWSLPEEGVPIVRAPLDGDKSLAALSPDGTLAIATGMTYGTPSLQSTRAYRLATGQPAGPSLRPGGQVVDAAFSPDGRSVATVSVKVDPSPEGQEVIVWDWANGFQRWRGALPFHPRSLCYRGDGRRLAVLCGDGMLLIFDPADGREITRWEAHQPENLTPSHWINNGKVAFSPDGRSVFTWGLDEEVRVWDLDMRRLRYPPIHHRDKCHDVQFSPDGKSMALASYDASVRVRDVETGAILVELPTHPDLVYSASFSPDGRRLVTACRDRMVRTWDWREGRLACPPFEHLKEVMAAAFTPDGRRVISISDDGTARVWDLESGKPLTPPLAMKGNPMSVAVTPDGQHAVVGGFQSTLAMLNLGVLTPDRPSSDADALCLRAELLAGQRLHEGGGMVNLAADEWFHRWRAFRRQSPAGDAAHLRDALEGSPPGRP